MFHNNYPDNVTKKQFPNVLNDIYLPRRAGVGWGGVGRGGAGWEMVHGSMVCG